MRISLFTDEVAQEPPLFLSFFREHRLQHAELRMINGRRLPWLEPGDRRALPGLLAGAGLQASALSPGLFKGPAEAGPELLREGLQETLPATLALAAELGCRRILVFAPHRPAGTGAAAPPPPWLEEGLRAAAALAAAQGCRLCLENEPGTWADSSEASRRLLTAVGHPHLRANWDPANAFFAEGGGVWPGGYRALRPLVEHVHVKDVAPAPPGEPRFVPLGEGVLPWAGMLRDLRAEGYMGFLTLETHCEPLTEATPAGLARLRQLLAATGP